MRFPLRSILLGGLITALPVPAMAHVVFAEPKARSGSYYPGFFRVSHGCGPSDTLSVRISIPEGVVSARPQPKPGWTLNIEKTPLATPIKGEGGTIIKDKVTAITWTGRLSADQFDQFGVMMKLPDSPGPLYFPVEQKCVAGENRWVNIPAPGQAWHSVTNPAPVIELTKPDDMAGMHH
jgi:periplasmic copper chaperone A